MTDAAPSPASAAAAASSPGGARVATPGVFPPGVNVNNMGFRPPPPGGAMPGQVPHGGAMMLDDDKKREMIAAMDPARIMALRKVST